MIRKSILGLLLSILGAIPVFPEQITSTSFKGLNSNENSVLIDPSEAQDLLNVNVTAGGKSIKKREGFGLYKALGTGEPVRGGYHAFNLLGNDYQIWGSSTNLYGIVSDGTPILLVSSATIGSTWDCSDTQGYSYCVDSNRDGYFKTDGSASTWYASPAGTMIESTPDRMIVSGVQNYPSTLYVSESNNFINYTTGVNETDAFTEVIAAPGSKITHIRWGCGKVLWWKDASFGYFDFDDQYSAQIKTVSDTIGTLDNTSTVDPSGQVYFRGQDGHTWKYDCSSLEKMSLDIEPSVQISGKRISNSWEQTTQSDFEEGVSSPSYALSTSIDPGSIVVSSYQYVLNSSTQWNSGSVTNLNVYPSSMTLKTNTSGNGVNPGFSDGETGWTGDIDVMSSDPSGMGCTQLGHLSTYFGRLTYESNPRAYFKLLDKNGNVLYTYNIDVISGDCSWHENTVSAPAYTGRRVKFSFVNYAGNHSFTSESSYIFSGTIKFWNAFMATSGGSQWLSIDNISMGTSTITDGSFLSQAYDTGLTSATYYFTAGYSVNTSTPYFYLVTSTASTGEFMPILDGTGTFSGERYYKVGFVMTNATPEEALTSISSMSVIARSSGSYYSKVHYTSALTDWGTFVVDDNLENEGTLAYSIRASTSSFDILSATPSWTSQTKNSLITISTGTYVQVKADFGITHSTQNPALNSFKINSYEGSAADQAYLFYFKDALWESVVYGLGESVNNYIFRYDLVNEGWTFYDIGTGGMVQQGNRLYFGDPTSGNIFIYGDSNSDNGNSINAYWRTKSFTGSDPFLQNQYRTIDLFAKKSQGYNLTATYTLETSTRTSYSVSLSTSNDFVQNRKWLPNGKLGYVFDLEIGDNSASSSWEFLGYRVNYDPLPYRPTP